MNLSLSLADPFDSESIALISALWFELGEIYGDLGPCEFTPDQIAGSGCHFVVARVSGEVVGCAAIIPMEEGVCELKRVYVAPEARNQGVAAKIIAHMEQEAARLGYRAIRLETGTPQEAAVRLYEREGYTRIPNFGRWKDDPLSVCYEKRLGVPEDL